jgi:hypothetical protein
MPKINKVTHPHAWELTQARKDAAHVAGKPMVERPYWYEDEETGKCFWDLYGCVAWPTEVTDKDDGRPGYVAIIGVIKGQRAPQNSVFHLCDEAESKDIPTLLKHILDLRSKWGFGLTPGFLQTFFGDPDRFVMTLALLNEDLMRAGGDNQAILIAPPDDFGHSKSFDHYVRSMHSVLVPDRLRFGFGGNEILKNRLKEFRRDDPAVMGVGGLVHSLLSRTTWMEQTRESIFVVEEGL